MSLKDLIARDIDNIFLNTDDFCDDLVIQIGRNKYNVVGSLQSNSVENNSGSMSAPLQEMSYTLYIKYPIADELERTLLSSGARITIDSKSFTVVNVSDEMGLATILLQSGRGR